VDGFGVQGSRPALEKAPAAGARGPGQRRPLSVFTPFSRWVAARFYACLLLAGSRTGLARRAHPRNQPCAFGRNGRSLAVVRAPLLGLGALGGSITRLAVAALGPFMIQRLG
jgi:hypothetical protein